MYCPKCGYKCEESELFCPNCGTALHSGKDSDEIDDTYAQKIDVDRSYNGGSGNNIKSSANANIGTYGLICSIVGLIVPYIGLALEIAAIVLGTKAKGTATEKNGKIGRIIAIVGLILWPIAVILLYISIQ